MVSDEMKLTWWGDFVQKYYWDPIHYNVVRLHWKKTMMSLISNFISKRKRSGKIPPFMSSEHWGALQTYWGTEPARKKSKSASESRCSDQGGLGQHIHTAGSTRFMKIKYDTKSEFAKDVLAVQVSSVASESAFSTSGRILDPYRSSLTPYMIEALICTQQWMRSSNQSQPAVANLAQMLEEVDFFESLDSRNSQA